MEIWDIMLDSWVTMDWGYNDVACGEIIESPLYFSSDSMASTDEMQKHVERAPNRSHQYRVVAEVTAVWDYKWEIDFGLRAISANPVPDGVTRGSYVTGELLVGIEYPGNWSDYQWFIESITKETAPLVPIIDENGQQRGRRGDRTQITHQDVKRTDGYGDGLLKDTHIMYILHCRRTTG